MANNVFQPIEGENIILQSRVGKKILSMYLLLQVLCGLVGSGILLPGAIWYAKIDKAYLLIIFGAVVYLTILLLYGHYYSTKHRLYVFTDKRIVIIKGGKVKRAQRTLILSSIQGVEKRNNALYNLFGLATIDFYALAVASNVTKMKLISFSSTDFKFQWVDKQDAEAVYEYMQTYLVNGTFPISEAKKEQK